MPTTIVRIISFLGIIPLVCCGIAYPDSPKINYADNVKPILREHCFSCHNQNKATNDLALDSYERLRKGGASGEAIAPGDPDGSYLFSLVSHKDQPHMPPNADRLPQAKLDIIKQWIAAGAPKDSGSKVEASKPAANLAMAAGAAKPEGPPVMPEGVSRQAVVYTAKPGALSALAASPWAPLVAVGGSRQVLLYNTDTAELLGVLPFPEGKPMVLRFSRSGKLLLAGGGKAASRGLAAVYDVKTGKRLFQVGDELDAVLAADINASQTLIALGGPQKIVRVFSTADGSQVAEIHKHTDWITAVEFSPDGVLLATADRAGGLWAWEAGTDREFHNLEGHKAAVTAVSWRDDSNVLSSASEDGTIKLWGLEEGKLLKSIPAHGEGVTTLQFAHDGRLVSGGRDRAVKIWDAGGRQLRAFDPFGELVMKAVFVHDAARIVAGDWSGDIRLSSVADGKIAARLASNPPTLDMLLTAAKARQAETEAAAAKAAKEAADAQRIFNEKKQAADAATKAADAARKTSEQLPAEKAAAKP